MMITSEEIKKMKEKLGIIIKSYFNSAPAQNNGDKVKDGVNFKHLTLLERSTNYLILI